MILVADIGGTNARFALANKDDQGSLTISAIERFRAEDFETVRDAADAYLESVDVRPQAACFAVAGPVAEDAIHFTNSPWAFSQAQIAKDLNMAPFQVVNDFEALAGGIPHLVAEDLLPVRAGTPVVGAPQLVIGPGTGLGQALLVPCAQGQKVIPTEGGHVSFAPRSKREVAIMEFIAREHPRVSVERLLCGRGLINIHRALCAIEGAPRPALQADEITRIAAERGDPLVVETLAVFCEVLGQVVGDAVLSTGARGGVFLGGGILPKIKDIFLSSQFENHFLDKGRMRSLLEQVPIELIVSDTAALFGAAAFIE